MAGLGRIRRCRAAPYSRLVRVQGWVLGVQDRHWRAGSGALGEWQQSWQGRELDRCIPPGSIPGALLLSLGVVANPVPGTVSTFIHGWCVVEQAHLSFISSE